MNPYINEDLMWERLKDIQREVENSRLIGRSGPRAFDFRGWLSRLFARRAPATPLEVEDQPTISDVA